MPVEVARLSDAMEGPVPAGLIEKVNELMKGGVRSLGQWDLFDPGFGHHDGPVDETRPSQDVLSWYKTPEAAVHTIRAVIAQDKITAARNDQTPMLDVRW
jgi:hypothetical protein